MMKTPFQFRSRLATGGEILAQQATFLPVEPARPFDAEYIHLSKMQYLAGFLPVLGFNGKKTDGGTTVAKGVLR